MKENGRRNAMKLICHKCGEVFHYGGYWHPDLGSPLCYDCLGIDREAEEASYRDEEDDEEE